jgi:hypothetical protein
MFVMEIECDVRKGEEGCKKNKRGNGCKLCERKLAFRAFRFGLVVGTKARECASESMSEAVHRAYSTICMARAASPEFIFNGLLLRPLSFLCGRSTDLGTRSRTVCM